jgi:AcrR family transcriptional regulator
MSSRSYDASRRQEGAARTREHILAAGRALFIEHGYAATTMNDVAQSAGVAPATAAAAFGGKAGLLKRLVDVGITGDDQDVPVSEREVARQVAAASDDAGRQCELLAAFVTEVHQRLAPLHEVLTHASGVDEQVQDLMTRTQQGRRAGMAEFVALIRPDRLKQDLDGDAAADIVWALTEPRLYTGLVGERGWTDEQYEAWLVSQLTTALLR